MEVNGCETRSASARREAINRLGKRVVERKKNGRKVEDREAGHRGDEDRPWVKKIANFMLNTRASIRSKQSSVQATAAPRQCHNERPRSGVHSKCWRVGNQPPHWHEPIE